MYLDVNIPLHESQKTAAMLAHSTAKECVSQAALPIINMPSLVP